MITICETCSNNGFYTKRDIKAGFYKLICAYSAYLNASNGSASVSMDVCYRYNNEIATNKSIFKHVIENKQVYFKDVVAIDFPVFTDITSLYFGVFLGYTESGSTFYYQNIYLVRI